VVNVHCGPGTTLVNGTCIATPTDATPADTGSGELDSGGGNNDAGDAATEPDEPCPMPAVGVKIRNCDPACGEVYAECAQKFCPSSGPPTRKTKAYFDGIDEGEIQVKKWILRLPRDPWKTYGTCDPNGQVYNEANSTPYEVEVPQPKFFTALFLWGLPIQYVMGQQVTEAHVEAKNYETRMTAGFRCDLPCSNPGPDYLNRSTPAPKQGVYGAIDIAKQGCRNYTQLDIYPYRDGVLATASSSQIILSTSREHMPATNIVIQAGQQTCAGK
jgi:hypothetical protein